MDEDDDVFDLNRNTVNSKSPANKKEFLNQLVKDYIHYKAYGKNDLSCKTSSTIRRVSEELEGKNEEFFNEVCAKLDIQDESAEQTFKVVSEDVLKDRMTWGRLVSLFVFSGKIAEWFQAQRLHQKIDEVCEWLTESIFERHEWIEENGGWDAFDEHFEDISPFHSSLLIQGLALATTLGVAAVVAVKLKSL